jgi:hypothetical protein
VSELKPFYFYAKGIPKDRLLDFVNLAVSAGAKCDHIERSFLGHLKYIGVTPQGLVFATDYPESTWNAEHQLPFGDSLRYLESIMAKTNLQSASKIEDSLLDILIGSFILRDDYNGHSNTTLCKSTLEALGFNGQEKLIGQLENYLRDNTDWGGFVSIRRYSDGSGSVVAEDWWSEGEHHSGHRDKTLFSFE